MRTIPFSPSQIIRILKEAEGFPGAVGMAESFFNAPGFVPGLLGGIDG